jgi:GTP cyclohydrolase I
VRLKVSIAYFPNGKVIGASKLARLLHDCNRYPMTQEAFTASIAQAMERLTEGTSTGEAVFVEGYHGCMEIRGVKSNATLITTKFTGKFSVNEDLQRRFHDLVCRS